MEREGVKKPLELSLTDIEFLTQWGMSDLWDNRTSVAQDVQVRVRGLMKTTAKLARAKKENRQVILK